MEALALDEAQAILDEAGVPAGPVMSIADIAADEQYQARGMIAGVPDERMPDGVAYMPGIVPHLTGTPGAIVHSGGNLGADNAAIYGASPIIMLVVTLGVSLILQNVIAAVFTSQFQNFNVNTGTSLTPGLFLFTPLPLGIIRLAIVTMPGVHILLRYTRLGKAMRMVARWTSTPTTTCLASSMLHSPTHQATSPPC